MARGPMTRRKRAAICAAGMLPVIACGLFLLEHGHPRVA